jgi:hypothetical protein
LAVLRSDAKSQKKATKDFRERKKDEAELMTLKA